MPVRFQHATLDNGLQVIAEVDPTAHTAAIGFFVKTGARDEDASIMGVSHFLEHMMFKGSPTRRAEEVDRAFDDIGADHNAYTTSELTAFWSHCLPEKLQVAELVLSDILRPALRQEDFEQEKKVILEEIAMYQDQPFWVLYERTMEVYYGQHPLSHRVLGTEDTIKAMAREEMAEYFRQRYSSDNTVVALAGRLDFEAIVGRLQEHCGTWERTGVRRSYPMSPAPREEFTIESTTAGQHYLLILCAAPSVNDDRRYAAGMLMQVLGDTEGSRLYWSLVETGLAEDAAAQFDGRDGLGEFIVYASCGAERAEEVERIAIEQMRDLADSLTEDDLLRVRSRVATAATLHGELPSGRMRRLGRLWTYTGAYRSLEEELEQINAVTLDDLRELAAQYPLEPQVIGRLTPAG
jgi:predicted Zn-dependent peptidase